jgi:hypothetical protein
MTTSLERAAQFSESIPPFFANLYENSISTVESYSDSLADFVKRNYTYLDSRVELSKKSIVDKVKKHSPFFWNVTASIFRYALAPVSWHFPRQIVKLEGHSKVGAAYPQFVRIQKLARKVGLAHMPTVFECSSNAWQLPNGGWSGILQPTLVTKESDSNVVIQRQLIGIQLHETSIQAFNFTATALSIGLLFTNLTSPFAPIAKLALIVGGYVTSYIGTQIAIDNFALDKLNENERAELKNELSRIKALPLFDASMPLLSRIQSIPNALYLIPSYIRSISI